MMQSGNFTGYFPHGLEETAKRIRGHGFNTAQLYPHFKDIDLGPGQLTEANCKKVRDTLTQHVKIAHAKDVARAGYDKSEKHADIGDDDALASHRFRGVGEIVLNAPGTGSMNYDLYLQRLAEKHPNIAVIIEHLDEADVPGSKAFLHGRFAANGV